MKSKARNYRRGLFILGMIALPMLNFLIFYVYVNFNSIVMAFQVLKEGELTWSMNNFVLFFEQITDTETVLFGALGNTMKFFSVQLFVLLPATTLIAYFIYKKIFGYRFFRIMFFVPTILSTVLLTILYSNIIGMNSPVAKLFQNLFSLPAVPEFLADKRYALNAIIVYVVWTGFGTNLYF